VDIALKRYEKVVNGMDLQDIKSRIFKDNKGNNIYMNVSVEEMDWLVEQAEKSGAVHSRHFLMDTINKQQEKINLLEKLIKEFDNHLGTKEESEFIHVFQRVLIHHHMDSKFTNSK
jgi:hypothetical protein